MSRIEAEKITKKFAQALRVAKYPLRSVYLFGSCAMDKAHKWSDIDVAVVTNISRYSSKKEDFLWTLKLEIDNRIEPHFLSLPDFKDGSNIIACEVKKYGIRVA
jgi:predicted nucleotidyltransferase